MNAKLTTFKCFAQPEKEEAWLAQMALRGWFLTGVSPFYFYTFEQGAPEKRAYKIDYRSFRSRDDREDYLALFKDSGWQPALPREANGAFYFTSSQDPARLDIFSDEVSRAERNLRYARLTAFSLLPAFLPLLVLYLTGTFSFGGAGYQTPGLWQMSGSEFWFHFLFETPFVLLRSLAYLLPLAMVAMTLVFLLRYYLSYRRAVSRQAL